MPKVPLLNGVLLIFLAQFLVSCATVTVTGNKSRMVDSEGNLIEASAHSVEMQKATQGMVLLDAMWGRVWKCGGYENAQLVNFAFDKMPLTKRTNEDKPDIEIGSANTLLVDNIFDPLAIQVPAGEYVLSGFKIKVAKSTSDVGYITVPRSALRNDPSTFSVNPGEVVYIGHFSLDCAYSPIIWRYYIEQMNLGSARSFTNKYPFINLDSVVYRLFKTKSYGGPIIIEQKK